jgi:hypothetical protein
VFVSPWTVAETDLATDVTMYRIVPLPRMSLSKYGGMDLAATPSISNGYGTPTTHQRHTRRECRNEFSHRGRIDRAAPTRVWSKSRPFRRGEDPVGPENRSQMIQNIEPDPCR